MDELTKQREEINRIDKEMAALFEQRMDAAGKIAEYKRERALPVKDKNREDSLIESNRELIRNPEYEGYYAQFLRNTLDISCRYQEKLLTGMKVAYSGVEGAFAYIAAKTMFPTSTLVCKNDFNEAYKSAELGDCDCVVLPLENSYAGEVGAVLDLAFSGSLHVNQVIELPVRHCLLGIEGSPMDKITTVVSHPQALVQCSEYISNDGYVTREFGNTALAAKLVKESGDPTLAAIASKETAEIMGLKILDSKIQDSGINTTRFAAFSNQAAERKGSGIEENFILMFTVKDVAGALAKTLNIIGAFGYNMKSLRSRPMKDSLWNYYFFMEAEGNINTQNGKDMMKQLSAICPGLKLLGTYRTARA